MKKCKIVPFVHVLLKFSNISFTVILKSEYRLIGKKIKNHFDDQDLRKFRIRVFQIKMEKKITWSIGLQATSPWCTRNSENLSLAKRNRISNPPGLHVFR
jgi:hypothetical protein